MAAMNETKAQELIAELEKHQHEQIRCLKILFGLASENEVEKRPEVMEEVKGMHAYTAWLPDCHSTPPFGPS